VILGKLGYCPSQYDNSLYVLKHSDKNGVIWIHVDDGVVTASSNNLLRELECNLKQVLKIKWSAQLESIVGVSIQRMDNGFILTQPKLINGLLEAEWNGVIVAKTPLPPGFNAVTEAGDPSTSMKYLLVIGPLS
jgi:hypothetical protein